MRKAPLLLIALLWLSFRLEAAAQEYFKGKTITIVAGYPSGGGVDSEARLLARFLARHIPGNPSLIVRNMPGAGGMVAANWFETLAKPDGLTLQYISFSSVTQQVFGAEGLKYDLRKWDLLGSIVRSTSVALIRPEKLDRLTDRSKPNLAVGSRTGDDSWNPIFLWGAEYLNWNVRWVLGYGGGGEMRLAFQRGETDLYASANLPALHELVAAGFHPFVQQGRLSSSGTFQRRPEFPKVPTFEEMLEKKRPGGVAWQAYVSWAGADGAGRPLVKGMAKSAMQALQGKKATLLIDKLAERLAFERSGTRLYEALMLKCKAANVADQSATMMRLEEICADELRHFHLIWDCIEKLGGDPTVQTPSADTIAVASQGLPQVLLDPRTTFPQCLEAVLTAELVDCDAWERLIELVEGFNQTDMVEQFSRALLQEKEHRVYIRDLLEREVKSEAGISAS